MKKSNTIAIGPDKDRLRTYNCIYFLTYQFKHVLSAQKNCLVETVLLSTHNRYVLVKKNKENNFQIRTLIWRPDYRGFEMPEH